MQNFILFSAGATYFSGPHSYGSGTGNIFLDEVECSGNETNLLACSHNLIGFNDCIHLEDVGVSCCSACSLPGNYDNIHTQLTHKSIAVCLTSFLYHL